MSQLSIIVYVLIGTLFTAFGLLGIYFGLFLGKGSWSSLFDGIMSILFIVIGFIAFRKTKKAGNDSKATK